MSRFGLQMFRNGSSCSLRRRESERSWLLLTPVIKRKELEYLLKQSESTHLFIIDGVKSTSYTKIAQKIKASNVCVHLKHIVYIDQKETPEGMLSLQKIIDNGKAVTDNSLIEREQSLSPEDVINMQYTSGTTGFPKGVMLTHLNIINNAFQVATAMDLQNEDRLCIPVPFISLLRLCDEHAGLCDERSCHGSCHQFQSRNGVSNC